MLKIDERKCPQCAEPIKVDAPVCRNCGREFSAAEVKAAKKEAKRNKLTGCLGCGGIALVLLFAIGMCTAPATNDNSTAAVTSTPSTAPSSASADARAALIAQYRQLIAVATPCDKALIGLQAASDKFSSSGDVLQMMAATTAGQTVCAKASATIKDMTPPEGLPEKSREAMEGALRSCLRGYDRREQALVSATTALGGGDADLTGAVNDVKRSHTDVVNCLAGVMIAASEAGIDMKDMQ